MEDQMVERLMGILQGISDSDIKRYLTGALQNSIKHINADTHEIFFNDEQKCLPKSASRHENAYSTYSAKYVANAIQQCSNWNFHKTVANCGRDALEVWLEQKDAIACGQDLINDCINERIDFNIDLNLLQKFSKYLKTNEEKTGLAEFMRLRPWTGNVFLTFLLQRDGNLYNEVLADLKDTIDIKPYISDIQMYSWLKLINAEVDSNSSFYQQVSDRVKERINVPSTRIVQRRKGTCVPGTHDVVTTTRDVRVTTYGAGVVRWLEVVGSVYGVTSGTKPKNIQEEKPGCVKAGTLITMADGTHRPVEALRKGDRVLNAYGEVSICSAELVVNPNVRTLYSVNDDAPFMSLEHPVLTQRGYCCLNPSLALSINDTYPIYELQTGDVILKYAGTQDGKPQFVNVPVEKINIAANEDVCYDLHFSDGWNSYIANEYCVLLTYPSFTANEAARKLGALEGPEQSEFHRDFLKAKPMLQRLISAEQLRFFEQTLFQDKKVSARSDLLLGERILHFDVYGTGTAHPGWKNLTLYKGSLLFDEQDAVVTEIRNDVLYWRRQTNGAEETGMLKFLFNHRMAMGVVKTEAGLVPFTALSEVRYRLTFTEEGGAPTQDSYVFTMGFQPREGSFVPFARLENEKGQDLHAQYRFFVQRDPDARVDLLNVALEVSARYVQRGMSLFSKADLALAPSYKSLHGTAQNSSTKLTLTVTGTLCDPQRADAWARRVRRLHMAAKADAKVILQSEILSQAHRDTLRAAMELSVEDLFALPQPESMKAVHERAFTVLKKMMLYVIDDNWRKDYFNVQKPSVGPYGDLTQEQANLAQQEKIKDFLCNEFGLGFITNALYKSSNETIEAAFSRKFPDRNAVQRKLDYFWKGVDSEKCFCKTQGYNAATTIIYTDVYADSVERLKEYKNDTVKKAEYWAKTLYDYCMEPAILFELAFSYLSSEKGQGKIMHLTTMLNYLDPEENDISIGKKVQKTTYANALYFQTVNYLATYMREHIGGERTAQEETDCKNFLNQFFSTFFESLLADEEVAGERWDETIRAEAVEEIKKEMEARGVSSVKALVTSLSSILGDLIGLYISIGSSGFLEEQIQKFVSKYPSISRIVRKGAVMGFYGLALFEVFAELQNFSQMSKEQKALFIGETAGIACLAFNDVAQMRNAAVLAKAQIAIEARLEAEEALAAARQRCADLANLEEPVDQIIAKASANVAARTTEEASIETACARWEKITQVSGKIAKMAGILVMAGATVVLGFQTARDFAEGQPPSVKALDIINVVCCGIGFLAEAGTKLAGLFVENVCKAIPFIGWIAAAVGIVVSLVLIFIPRKSITGPERFIEEHCIGFIKGLAEPSQEWLEKEGKLQQYLSSSNTAVPYTAMQA